MSGFGAGLEKQGSLGEDKMEEGGIGSIMMDGGGAQSEFSVDNERHPQLKSVKDQIENLILDLSVATYDKIKYHGKSRKDIF